MTDAELIEIYEHATGFSFPPEFVLEKEGLAALHALFEAGVQAERARIRVAPHTSTIPETSKIDCVRAIGHLVSEQVAPPSLKNN